MNKLASIRGRLYPAIWLLLALPLGLSIAAQTKRGNAPIHKALTPTEVPVPFQVGEKLSFRVLWSKYSVNAGKLAFAVVERRDFFGHPSWHFRASAQTVDTMRVIYPLDDQLDSYADTRQLASLQYEMYLHEQGKQVNNSWRFITDGSPAPVGVSAARVNPGARDPIALLYMLRAANWNTTPELRSPVFDGQHVYDVAAKLTSPADQVTISNKSFPASKIDLAVTDRGQEVSGMRFTLWLEHDAAHTPLLIEVELPIGSARVELTSAP